MDQLIVSGNIALKVGYNSLNTGFSLRSRKKFKNFLNCPIVTFENGCLSIVSDGANCAKNKMIQLTLFSSFFPQNIYLSHNASCSWDTSALDDFREKNSVPALVTIILADYANAIFKNIHAQQLNIFLQTGANLKMSGIVDTCFTDMRICGHKEKYQVSDFPRIDAKDLCAKRLCVNAISGFAEYVVDEYAKFTVFKSAHLQYTYGEQYNINQKSRGSVVTSIIVEKKNN